jgi:hypothetical protein
VNALLLQRIHGVKIEYAAAYEVKKLTPPLSLDTLFLQMHE